MRPPQPDLKHNKYRGVRLSTSDVAAGLILSTEADWNQTDSDWTFFLSEGQGVGFEDERGALIASAVLLPYGKRYAWICMVLVAGVARRQGLATALLLETLRLAQKEHLAPILDATPAGRAVYLGLGFKDAFTLTRWRRTTARLSNLPSPLDRDLAFPLSGGDLENWIPWDVQRFGEDRGPLLRALQLSCPDLAWQVGSPNDGGYSLGRAGRTCPQIGPLVATTNDHALMLLRFALSRVENGALIDVVDNRIVLADELIAQGFTKERSFTRMICGDVNQLILSDQVYAIAGPELG